MPEVALDLGLAVLAVGIAWLAVWLFDRSRRIATWTITGTPSVHRVAALAATKATASDSV